VTKFHGGDAFNVIPDQVKLTGTVRTLQPAIQDLMEKRITEVAEATASAFGTTARVSYKRLYPITINHEQQTGFAASVATEIAGAENVNSNAAPTMGAEDFAFMLNTRPGAFIFMGNGDSASLHNSGFDFNDEAIATGVSYWARLVETALRQAD
jgi:hippurate hydrolase